MKILLLGEYSNVHNTLAQGLRNKGHKVVVISNGDFWKNYPRDIDVSRTYTKWGGIKLLLKIYKLLPKLKDFDIVQIINPMFFELSAKRLFYIYSKLKQQNKAVVLGAFGMDYYWVSVNRIQMPLEYSDFNIGKQLRVNADALKEINDWCGTDKEKLNKYIASTCDGIVTGLYEYDVCYKTQFKNKTQFIPFPIKPEFNYQEVIDKIKDENYEKVKFFIGINKNRSEYKGTDIMLRAVQSIEKKYATKVELKIAESVPYKKYTQMMKNSHAILDQLYSYTPSMNPLQAMSEGVICIGGGEKENYEILNETELIPIINVKPNYESVVFQLEKLVIESNKIPLLREQSVNYIRKHHDYNKVAQEYIDFYNNILSKNK